MSFELTSLSGPRHVRHAFRRIFILPSSFFRPSFLELPKEPPALSLLAYLTTAVDDTDNPDLEVQPLSIFTGNDSRSLRILVPASSAHMNVQRTARWNTFVPSGSTGKRTHVHMYALWMNSKRWVTEDNRKEEKRTAVSACVTLSPIAPGMANTLTGRIIRVAGIIHRV